MITEKIRETLIVIAREQLRYHDPSHDIGHALRVLYVAERIASEENADLDVVIPSALFHDIISYPKNDPRADDAPDDSATKVRELLAGVAEYPTNKIGGVETAIRSCSFSKQILPESLEAKILQDADGLEATGAIAIMRTFASSGIMRRAFYDINDPFARERQPDDLKYALDLFWTRLMKVRDRMHTGTAKQMAEKRTAFLKTFLNELRYELPGN